PAHRQMEFRIGINSGDVIVEEGRLYGDGVNIAARLEGLADAGGICISGMVHEQVKNKLALEYEYLGEREVKNIAEPVRVWRIRLEESSSHQVASQKSNGESQKTRWLGTARRDWTVAVGISLLLMAGTIIAIRHLTRPPLSPQSSSLSTQSPQAL